MDYEVLLGGYIVKKGRKNKQSRANIMVFLIFFSLKNDELLVGFLRL